MRTVTELRHEAQHLRLLATKVTDSELLAMIRQLVAELELRAQSIEDDDDW